MNQDAKTPSAPPPPLAAAVPPAMNTTAGFAEPRMLALDELTDDAADRIEMLGEEDAAGYPGPVGSDRVSASVRYLHCSRTIHQLVTDRNRAVGLYLAVASLLWTASTALLNVKQDVRLIISIDTMQYWCVPVTLGVMTLLAVFTGFLLIRTRIGLIYEVAKMNALLGLPPGRVQRVNPLSIFFIMHLVVSLAGGGSALFLTLHLTRLMGLQRPWPLVLSVALGVTITAALVGLYIGTVLHTTTDIKLAAAATTTAKGASDSPAKKGAGQGQ